MSARLIPLGQWGGYMVHIVSNLLHTVELNQLPAAIVHVSHNKHMSNDPMGAMGSGTSGPAGRERGRVGRCARCCADACVRVCRLSVRVAPAWRGRGLSAGGRLPRETLPVATTRVVSWGF